LKSEDPSNGILGNNDFDTSPILPI
jgi:hypothetical protein